MRFNDVNLLDYFRIYKIDKSLSPIIENKSVNLPGMPGGYFIKQKIGQRIISAEVKIVGNTREEKEEKYHQLASILNTEKPKKLFLNNNSDRYFMAKIDSISDIDEVGHIGKVTITFVCFDPLAYPINKTIIEDISGKVIVNQGTWETTGQIIVDIDEDTNYLKVTLQETGEYIYLEDDFVSGDEILIDLEDEYIKKNGNLIMDKLHFESDFFDIPVGEFNITSSNGIIDIEFRERWL